MHAGYLLLVIIHLAQGAGQGFTQVPALKVYVDRQVKHFSKGSPLEVVPERAQVLQPKGQGIQ